LESGNDNSHTPFRSPPRGFWGSVRDALSGRQHDYTSGNLNRAIVLLAVPMVLEMCMESVFAVVDVYWVGRLGKSAVAAVGLTESVITLLYAIAFGLAMSTTAMVARRIGEKNTAGAVTAATQAVGVGILIAALIGIPGAIWGGHVLRLMGASDETIAVGGGYTRVMLGTNVVILLIFLNNAVFRGAGDAVIAMRALWLANGINIVLDPFLIFGWGPFPELGVTGAAVATTCGRGTGVVYQLWALRRGRGRVRLAGPACRFAPQVVLRLLRLSIGSIGQLLVATASWVALMRIAAFFGDDVLAGYTIAIRILIFAVLPAWGLSNAAATLMGQNLGARQPDRAGRAVWLTGAYNMAFMALVTLVFLFAAGDLIVLFNADPEVIAIGSEALRVISYGYVFYAWGMVMTQAFNGAGDTMTPTWVNLGCFWCFQIPLAWTLARRTELGPSGVFWAVMIAETVLALVLIALFRRGAWRTRKV